MAEEGVRRKAGSAAGSRGGQRRAQIVELLASGVKELLVQRAFTRQPREPLENTEESRGELIQGGEDAR